MKRPICALSIAGSDSSAGAGIQADLKTFAALGVWGECAVTSITAQNSLGVFSIMDATPSVVVAQIQAVLEDTDVRAIKIGMLSNSLIIHAIMEVLPQLAPNIPIILDPVMVAKSGAVLLQPQAMEALKKFIPHATLVTPNIPEANILLSRDIKTIEDMRKAAVDLSNKGCDTLLKGGHLQGEPRDILHWEGKLYEFQNERITTKEFQEFHGTGCTLSSAIAAFVALGDSIPKAVKKAKQYVYHTIRKHLYVGNGVPYLSHLKGVVSTSKRPHHN